METHLSKLRLRTKFLLSLLAISAGLTAATLLIVSYSVRKRVRESIRDDLRNSVNVYQTFQTQRTETLTRSAVLLANLPNVRALMTTQDAATIQDASADIWQLSGSDLLVLANRSGNVVGLRTDRPGLNPELAQQLLRHSMDQRASRDWWYGGNRLYEVWIQPIYFGAPSQNSTIGVLAVGHEIDERAARDFGNIASSEVAFSYGPIPVIGTLNSTQQTELAQQTAASLRNPQADTVEVQIGEERYLAKTVSLSGDGAAPVSLTVMRSFDKATQFLSELNHVLIGLGLVSILAGGSLVFLISSTFTKPLERLVEGVRALGAGDFKYPLESSGGDEVTEVTQAFVGMRASLESTQNEQKELEDKLRQAHKMEAIGRLAGGVAHDFNNLLTIIRGNSDLLIDREGTDEFHRRCVEQIQKAAGRAVSMTRQLLAFSRMQVLQPRVLDLNMVVSEMGKMLPRLIGEHIEYTFVPDPGLSCVKADPGQIEQIILNLAVNARDAMPQGGRLSVRTTNICVRESEAAKRALVPAGQYVLLSVTDTGHGMDESTKAHIFEPFFTTKEMGKGTGLGLATVYGIVKQSGGFIWAISAPKEGATFEIYLPPTAEGADGTEREKKPLEIPSGHETVLLVEDEPGVRDLACQFLRVKGYKVLEAKDGREALEIASRYEGIIHLLLSDMVMPGMNGGELGLRIRDVRPEIRMAFVTGYSEFARGDMGKSFPDAPVLQKPFSPQSLVEIVRQALGQDLAIQTVAPDECRVT